MYKQKQAECGDSAAGWERYHEEQETDKWRIGGQGEWRIVKQFVKINLGWHHAYKEETVKWSISGPGAWHIICKTDQVDLGWRYPAYKEETTQRPSSQPGRLHVTLS